MQTSDAAGPLLGALRAVTSTAPDLDAVERAWTGVMGYSVVSRDPVTAETAAGWGAPAVAGRPMLVMRPASGEPTFLRFVEQAVPEGHRPLTTYGWGGIEIVVQDPDALAERLRGSDFETLLEPHGVDKYPFLRAMQAQGPGGEMLNLTLIKPAQPGLPVAASFVGHCFIATLCVPDVVAARAFYARFGNFVAEPHDVRLSLVNHALDLPRETRHPLSSVSLLGDTKIELDELPQGSGARIVPPGGLPGGLAVVTLECADLGAVPEPFIAAPAPSAAEPARGRRTATFRGPAGELIELVETAR